MKKILLIGDSIRQGYDKPVREALAGQAEVYFPGENCRFAQYVLRNVREWKVQLKLQDGVDLVHWNAGLWDTLHLNGDDEPLTPPDVYAAFIRRCAIHIRKNFPDAIQIFALSTPVVEDRFDKANAYRLNEETMHYNRLAKEALADLDVKINDLWSVAEALPLEAYSDMTHLYTPIGTEAMSNAVLRAIIPPLGKKPVTYDGAAQKNDTVIGQ